MNSAGVPDRLGRMQTAFAAHIRDPDNRPAPADVEDRRMGIYRRLFFNNIRNLLCGNFPALRSLYTDDAWDCLVRDFYIEHRARTPLFPEISQEFLRYLGEQRSGREGDPPFLLELAHYEWVELALGIDDTDLGAIDVRPAGDLLAGIPVLSPLAWPLSYRFPVQRIRPDNQPASPPEEPTHLLVYRDRKDEVHFMELNVITRLLLQIRLERPDASGSDLLRMTAERSGHPHPQRVREKGLKLMRDLLERDILLGLRS